MCLVGEVGDVLGRGFLYIEMCWQANLGAEGLYGCILIDWQSVEMTVLLSVWIRLHTSSGMLPSQLPRTGTVSAHLRCAEHMSNGPERLMRIQTAPNAPRRVILARGLSPYHPAGDNRAADDEWISMLPDVSQPCVALCFVQRQPTTNHPGNTQPFGVPASGSRSAR